MVIAFSLQKDVFFLIIFTGKSCYPDLREAGVEELVAD